jgi:hypothetical protein
VGHIRHGRAATMMGERTMVLGGAWTTRSTGDDGGCAAGKCKVAASKMQSGGIQMRREKRNQAVFKF